MENGPVQMDGPASNLTGVSNFHCTMFDSESDKCVIIIALKRASAAFSLIGCFFMLLVIWLFRKYNSLAQKMILSLTLAALFDSIAYLMGEIIPDGALCNFQAWWLTYFDWCSLAWVCCITVNLYFNLVKETRTDHLAVVYYVAAWGVPFILSCLPLFGDYYGPAGAWCWITDEHVVWRFSIWYIPLFVLIFLMMSCYLHIFYVAKQRVLTWSGPYDPERERSKILLALEIRPLKWYPSVYLVVSLFPLINRSKTQLKYFKNMEMIKKCSYFILYRGYLTRSGPKMATPVFGSGLEVWQTLGKQGTRKQVDHSPSPFEKEKQRR